MKILRNKVLSRYFFILIAILIAGGSLFVSNFLVKDLSKEERSKIKIWAEATKEAATIDENSPMNLIIIDILQSNNTIPVVLYDKQADSFSSVNIELPAGDDEQAFLRKQAEKFENRHEPIIVDFEDTEQYIFYYDDSYTLKHLQLYPYVQLAILLIFIVIAIFAFLSTKKMEQDRLWVGLSKETAHQLGTPISSLLAWIEYLRLKGVEENIVDDMEKDINRLQMVTNRFSKIGSMSSLSRKDIRQTIMDSISYLEKRMSKRIAFSFDFIDEPTYANINEELFGWVIENLTKNAVDAMEGQGSISFRITENSGRICLDIQDSGKGIPKSKFKEVFEPGYTTKSRGWGLGLSLVKRIIESYHKGKIYVKHSESGVGTTFRIELKRA